MSPFRLPPSAFDNWQPTASLTTLQLRAEMLRFTRQFFDERGYFEVDTPLLSTDIVVDAWLEPFVCDWLPDAADWRQSQSPRYLQTSPEFGMKRLLAAGADAIYQLGKVFRNAESGRRHNPEFTMLEWYRRGDDHFAQMQLVEEFVRSFFAAAENSLEAPRRNAKRFAGDAFERLTYDSAFERYAGERVLSTSLAQLHSLAARHKRVPPPGLGAHDRDGWLNWLLAELVEPRLGRDGPIFLWGYPATQAALAQTSRDDSGNEIAHRFELYIDGIELCNGYHELSDPAVLRERQSVQAALRSTAGLRSLPQESRLLSAMAAGLPACAGVALGFDRVLMVALGASSIDEVIAFPFERA